MSLNSLLQSPDNSQRAAAVATVFACKMVLPAFTIFTPKVCGVEVPIRSSP